MDEEETLQLFESPDDSRDGFDEALEDLGLDDD